VDRQRSSASDQWRTVTPSRLVSRLALVATSVAVVVASVAATAGPVMAQEATGSPAPAEAASTVPEASGDIPFPSTLAGAPLDVQTYTGPEWLETSASGTAEDAAYVEQTEALLASLGKSIDDLTVKSALAQPSGGNPVVVAGIRIPGTEARTYIREMVRLFLGDLEQPELLMRQPLAGQWVLRVVDAATPGVYPRTVVIDGDTAWIIGGDEEYVQDLVSQLPRPEGPTTVEPELISSQLPAQLGGKRRAGLYESVEPLFLPTLSETLGPTFEEWLLDVYLDEGIEPTDLVGAWAWWGLQVAEEGVEVEGYLVPGASPEAVERLFRDVFLAGGDTLPVEVGRVDEEIGGKAVTTIDRGGGAKRHLFTDDGVVWVVTDHAGQPELAAEAIAALP
jgi:hypothetical protein